MNRRFGFCLIIGIILVSSACGREGDGLVKLKSDSETWLTHPNPSQLAAGLASEGDYLVAFRSAIDEGSPQVHSLLNGAGLRSRMTHSILNHTRAYPKVKFMNLLGSLNVGAPSRSFNPKPFEFPFKPQTLSLSFQENRSDILAISQVEFSSLQDADKILRRWYQAGIIWYAEPNFAGKLKGEFEDFIVDNFNDGQLYPWLDQLDFIEAIQFLESTNETPLIAVMDSGVDVEHPALVDNIFLVDDSIDTSCSDDLYGCDTTVNKKKVLGAGTVYPAGTDGFGQVCAGRDNGNCEHGTHVAGIVAANSSDYIGICPYCKILVVKVVGSKIVGGKESFQIEDSAIIAGLAYISNFKEGDDPLVRVINASFGKFTKSRSVGLFFESLTSFGRGILTVAAAGNEDTMKRQYPAALSSALAVANISSSTTQPLKAPSSNFGMWVDISAPGSGDCPSGLGILSSVPGGGAACREGTSMAAPIVAGVAGLLLAQEPNLDAKTLRSRLLASAIPDYLYQDGVNNAYRPSMDGNSLVPLLGVGVVNAHTALNIDLQTTEPIFTEKRDVVKAGCGSIGLDPTRSSWGFFLLLLPCLLKLISKRRS